MSETKTLVFDAKYEASILQLEEGDISDWVYKMPFDVGIVYRGTRCLGLISRDILNRLDEETEERLLEVLSPFEAVYTGSETSDAFCIYIYKIIQLQLKKKVFDANNQDIFFSTIFSHIRKQLNEFKYDKYIGRISFTQWLRTVINNKIIDLLRKQKPQTSIDEYEDSDWLLNSGNQMTGILNQKDLFKQVAAAIQQLPKLQKRVLLYNMEEPDVSGQNAAEALGMTSNAYYLNLNRARTFIQNFLTDRAPETVSIVKALRNRPKR
ncbi:MAG: RNA polymerase sigma factor [Lentisphaeria bacterium]|nr:RNA polymerase sigma factor [Lentisphaeria bacterium]